MPLDWRSHRLAQRATKHRRNAAARSRRVERRGYELAAAIEENLRLRQDLEALRRRHEAAGMRI